MVLFMSRYDIMHEYDNQWDAWPPQSVAFFEDKTHRYMAITEGLNQSLERVRRDYKKTTFFRQ
jgi:hypothetical protein